MERLHRCWICVSALVGVTFAFSGCGRDIMRTPTSTVIDAPFIRLPLTAQSWSVDPFSNVLRSGISSLGAFAHGRVSFSDAIQGALRDQIKNPLLGLKFTDIPASIAPAAGGQTLDVRFHVNGVEILGYQVRAHMLADRTPFILGTLPKLSAATLAAAPRDWPDVSAARDAIRAEMELPGSSLTFGKAKAYYHLAADSLVPVWEMRVMLDGRPFRAVSDGRQVVSFAPDFFSVDGTALVVPNTIADQAVSYTLPDLVGDGTLTSSFLQSKPVGTTPVQETSETFSYGKTDSRFAEVQAYAHVQSQYAWFADLGAKWYGPAPLQIKIHSMPGGTTNNALFMPGDDDGTLPSINVGDGDGVSLQNLATDAAVVRHEYGHHIIYETLQSTTGESLVIHEGLADSFVFFHADDPCLGHSICPVGGGACILDGQCLRTADNSFKYKGPEWEEWAGPNNQLGHLHGQILSGFLWDMRKNKIMSTDDLARMTLKAVSYFKSDSGLRDFMLAILTADRELFQCKYDTQLRQYAAARSLDTLIADVPAGCAALPSLTGGGGGSLQTFQSGGDSAATSSSHSSSKKGGICGVVAGSTGGGAASSAMILLLAVLPLLAATLESRRRRAPAPVKQRTRR